ncbi:MAG: Regulatory protein ArsR [Thermotoga sp. 50_1627]|uniref:ArsR/SmtB family transcription factor n=1 Tax=Pseudothermotoga sp. TaxID=2033661 RepID=UPI00076D9C65|nr:MAG: Regulatory protein ArsR [Thermotoga sp. 50_1627]MBC7116713.1 winged helix-turn-helix transcriptional regulator [Pseudothermotoga sp.]MDK2923696.1 ArsR family transcriptional regulator, arsenate/arsenite/antimonite-responsive transcriptional [Pseudothermotoga sp.]HBT39250.1 transcriptional regulator [Pseudothermotoga sp.]HCO97338.1 transcriptional regulator [Pseudothermotoga sp.]
MHVEKLFKALACRWRIEILKQIAKQDVCICELEALKHIDKTTLSRHISLLENVGIVELRREGQRKRMVLKDPRVMELIKLAEQIAEKVGEV